MRSTPFFNATISAVAADARAERKRAGHDKAWSFMVRIKIPGGPLAADEYLTWTRSRPTSATRLSESPLVRIFSIIG